MNSIYKQEVSKHEKKDAIIALCTFPIVAILTIVQWVILQTFELAGFAVLILQLSLVVFSTGMVFTIVLTKKQKLSSIGLRKDNLRPALGMVLLIILIYFAIDMLPMLTSGWEFSNLGTMTPLLLLTFVLAAWEDIYFVGYLQTRLYGLFKKDDSAIFVGAVLFALLHIPVGLYMDLGVIIMIVYMVTLCFMHLKFVFIFRRGFSLIPVFIAHALTNAISSGEFWRGFNPDYDEPIMLAHYVLFLILVIWEIVSWRHQKRQQTV